jgi:hypothetical protein
MQDMDFKFRKMELQHAYERLLSEDDWPVPSMREQFRKQLDSLSQDLLVISVCGQVKCGKSTLLNSLIFQDEILPVDDTPLTAKTTIIRYGYKPRFRAVFYSEAMWKELVQPKQTDKKHEALMLQVQKEIQTRRNQGVFPEDWIQPTAKKVECADLSQLQDYVGIHGRYTPFVQEVHLYYPSNLLTTAIFVDTPGINDPSMSASESTKKWIWQSHAVLFVTYAGRAFSSTDLQFIDRHLLHLPSESIYWVINKSDQIQIEGAEEDWINSVFPMDSPEYARMKEPIKNASFVSALGGMLQNLTERTSNLSEEMHYYTELLEMNGFLEPERHHIPALRNLLKNKLLDQRKSGIIGSHTGFILRAFSRAESQLQSSISSLEHKKMVLEMDKEELSEKLKQAKDTKRNLKTALQTFTSGVDTTLTDLKKTYHRSMKVLRIEIQKEIMTYIPQCKNIARLKIEFPWIFKHAIEGKKNQLKELAETYLSNVTQTINNHIYKLEQSLEGKTLMETERLTRIFNVSGHREIETFVRQLSEQIEQSRLEELIKSSTKFWQRWLYSKKAVIQLTQEMESQIEAHLKTQFSDSAYEISSMLKPKLEQILKELAKEIYAENQQIEGQINYLIHNEKKREEALNKIQAQSKLFDAKIKKLRTLKKSIRILKDSEPESIPSKA